MSQTPTKAVEPIAVTPWKAEFDTAINRWIVYDETYLSRHICYVTTGIPEECRERVAALIAEAGTVYHETKQTPRQILESREALRGAVSLLITIFKATADAADIDIETTQLKISRGGEEAGGLTIAEFLRKTEALTLAKEGGPK